MTAQSTAARAVWTALVFTREETFFAGRTMRNNSSYVPAGMFADPGWLLDQVAALFDTSGTVVVPAVPGPYHTPDWEHLPYVKQLSECARLAGERGWSTTDTALSGEYGWLTWTKAGAPTVHMGILPAIKDEGDQLVSAQDSPEVQADLLARYHAAVGVPWMSHAGVAGVNLARALYERQVRMGVGQRGSRARRQPLWIERLDDELVGAGDIMWSRHRQGDELARQVVAQWDIRMAYGAAAGVAELPVDALRERSGPTAWDPAVAGFWLIRVPEDAWWARNGRIGPPVLNPARVRADGTAWLTTPLLDVLFTDLKLKPEILDSRTTTHTDRVLREWYERLRDARTMAPNADSPRLSAAIKATANAAIGMMGSGRGRIQRRAWQHTIIDQARANLYRKLHKACPEIGWPFRIEHDSVWYAVPTPDDRMRYELALGVHPAMGRFRFVNAWSLERYEQDREAELAARRDRRAAR